MPDELASGTNKRFEHTMTTTAAPARVWELWADPSTWGDWDHGLREARLDDGFGPGASGQLTPRRGRSTPFEIVAVDHGVSYEFATALPGATLHVRRELLDDQSTTFRHTVWFAGPMAWLWSRIFGRQFRRALPPTMASLAQRAERTT